jgi:hypothetical protein
MKNIEFSDKISVETLEIKGLKKLVVESPKKYKDSFNIKLINSNYSYLILNSDLMSANFTIEGMKKYNESIKEDSRIIGLIGEKSQDFFYSRILGESFPKFPKISENNHGIICNFLPNNLITLNAIGIENPFLELKSEDKLKIENVKKLKDYLLINFVFQEAQIIIIVLEEISLEVKEIIKKQRFSDSGGFKKEIIVILNMNKLQSIKDISVCAENFLVNNLKLALVSMGTFERKEICFGIEKIEEEKRTEVKYFVVGSNKNLKIENEFNKHVYSYIRDCIVVQIAKKI